MIINDDDCDIEPLCLTDFECDENETPPPGARHCVEMTKLATLSTTCPQKILMQENQADVNYFVVGRAIRAVRSSQIHRDSTDSKGAIDEDLSAWEKQLPEPLRYHEGEPDPQAMQFAAMLMLGFQYVHDPPFLFARVGSF